MNIKHNPPRRIALILGLVLATGIFFIFLPGILGLHGYSGGFALFFLGGFIIVLGLIAIVTYLQSASLLDQITKKETLLAYWKFNSEDWKQYKEQEPQPDFARERHLFLLIEIMVVAVGLIFGLLVWVKVRGNLYILTAIVLGIIAVTGIAAWIYGRTDYRNTKTNEGEVYISLNGVYINRQVHIWKGLGNQLEDILFENNAPRQSCIKINCSSPGREGRYDYTLRIPVPSGQEDLARKLAADIAAAHLSRK